MKRIGLRPLDGEELKSSRVYRGGPGAAAIALIVATLTIWAGIHSSWSKQNDLGLSWKVFLFSALFVGTSLCCGLLVIRLAGRTRLVESLALALIVGSSVVGSCLAVAGLLLPIAASEALALLFLIASSVMLLLARRGAVVLEPIMEVSWTTVLAMAVALAGVTAAARSQFSPFADVGEAVSYRPWSDGFMLAGTVAEFIPRSLARPQGPWRISGETARFYHYGSLTPASAFSGVTGAPALTAVNAFAIPWSLFLVAMAAWAMGSQWWGERGGALSLVMASFLPDASTYGMKNAWFGYHWLMQTSPSLPWGVALSSCAILLVVEGCRSRQTRSIGLGLCIALVSVFFKAQISVLLLPALLSWAILFYQPLGSRRRIGTALAAGMAIALGVAAANRLGMAPTIGLSGDWGERYLSSITPLVVGNWSSSVWSRLLDGGSVPGRLILLLLASYGALGLAYLALTVARWPRAQAGGRDLIPLFFLVMHSALVLGLAPNENGNSWELHHRPFVLVYFLLAVWCGGIISRRLWKANMRTDHRYWLSVAALSLALALWFGGRVTGQDRELFATHLGVRIAKDHLKCIDLVRRHADRADVIQAQDNDPFLVTAGMSELTSYIAATRRIGRESQYSEVVERRLETMRAFRSVRTASGFLSAVEELPIRWYLVHPDGSTQWPSSIDSKAAFECGRFRVFDLDQWRN